MTLTGSSTVSAMARALRRVHGHRSATLNSTLQAIQLRHLIQNLLLLQIQNRHLTHLQQSMCILMVIARLLLMVPVPLCRTAQNAHGLILLVIRTLGIPLMLIADAIQKEIRIRRLQVSSLPSLRR